MDQPKLVGNWWGRLFFEPKHIPKRQKWSFPKQPTAWWHNAWTKWCQVLGGAADVAEDDQKIQLFILAFNQIKEVEVRCGIWVQGKVVLLHPGASGMMWSQLAGRQLESMIPMRSSRSGQAEWYDDHPSSHLAMHKVWGDSLRWTWFFFLSGGQLQRKWHKASYRIGSWFDLLMEQGRSSDLFSRFCSCQGFWRRMTLRRTSPSWPRTMLRKTADNLTHRRWLHSMDDLFDQGQVFNIYSK